MAWLALCLPQGPPQPPVPFAELSGVRRFNAHTLNYSTLLLEDDRGILYVGARGAIFALNSSDVADGSHHTVSPASGCCLSSPVPHCPIPVQVVATLSLLNLPLTVSGLAWR
ncbi:hypothetical protein IHE44_0001528 [Lamprotornis superbus]|uniref:Sema domain-containing protein n=1 Tax=Lamprotornis superbus TaxID=245042 RepID=A0A835NTL9_9PASS|nr:hypothetical protein IHE44_0001528 [Lamprotornis superbus]